MTLDPTEEIRSDENHAGPDAARPPVTTGTTEVWELASMPGARGGRLLIIDNYDSFTYNLVQLLSVTGVDIEVVRNDRLSVDQILARGADGLVLSPGPGRPEDAGICVELLERRPRLPVLGVCLGHQAMGHAFGARIERASVLMHGKTSEVRFEQHPMFDSLPQPFTATRYHSLCVAPDTLPDTWQRLAWSEEGTLMAMAHRELPYWGVQFHPESVLTEVGPLLLGNFVELVRSQRAQSTSSSATTGASGERTQPTETEGSS